MTLNRLPQGSYRLLVLFIFGILMVGQVNAQNLKSTMKLLLHPGWNWISVNVEGPDMSIATVLASLTPEDGDYIKSRSQSATWYTGVGWFGDLTNIDPEEMYKIKMTLEDGLKFEGLTIPCDPILINIGWNWIGYLPQTTLDIKRALASINPVNKDYIKSRSQSSTYYDLSGWFGDLEELNPFEGYMLKSSHTELLVYPGCEFTGTFTDLRDSHVYGWTEIGTQIWMSENLAWLPEVSPPTDNSEITSYFYVYGYEGTDVAAAKATDNYTNYGVLYNWPAATKSCPDGWHLPSDAEWQTLADFISADNGGYTKTISGPRIEWESVAGHLKTTSGWDFDQNGINDYLFSAVPGGYKAAISSVFTSLGSEGSLWSSTDYSGAGAYGMYLNDQTLGRLGYYKPIGFGVRCVKD